MFYLLLALVTATVVLMIQVGGLILVIPLHTLPAAAAGQWSVPIAGMMICATLIGGFLTSGALALCYAPEIPAGPTIILLAGALYLISATTAGLRASRRAE